MKGIERALKVFAIFHKKHPSSQFWVVGRFTNNYKKVLVRLSRELSIQSKVKFYGFVSEKKKIELLSKAHVLINPSYKEGWGLVNIEANARGTPAVAFDVPGNRDSIKNGVNGYLVKDGSFKDLALALEKVCRKGKILQKSSLKYSRIFNWDFSSDKFYVILSKVYKENHLYEKK